MGDLRTAAREALDFLDNCDLADSFNPPTARWVLKVRDALRAALDAGQAQPVAYMYEQAQWNEGDLRGRGWYPKITRHLEGTTNMRRNVVPLYAAPQASQPVAPAGWKPVPVWKVRRAAEILDRDGDEHGIAADLLAMLADDAAPPAPAAQPLTEEHDAALADLSMMLKKCAWALRRGSSPELGERALELLKRHGLLGSPLRSSTHEIGARP